ncbi:MAG TPA: hypothetical protein VFG72_05325 [Marmoricola sp.]|nr:hypothetical protein [Marmoricola sp.]
MRTTPETRTDTDRNEGRDVTRWAVPAVALLAGLGYLVAGLLGDDPRFAWFGLGLMVVVGVAFLVLARFSETAAGLRDRNDERINQIDASATTFAGSTVLLVVIAMFMVEVARGQDGAPYSALGAVGGVAYVVALVWLRFRR